MKATERLRRWQKLAVLRGTLLAQRDKEYADTLDEAVKVEDERNALLRQNEYLRKRNHRLRTVLAELEEIYRDVRVPGEIDSFTLQPARMLLRK